MDGDAIAAVRPISALELGRFWDLFPKKFAGTETASYRRFEMRVVPDRRIMDIQAVDQVDAETTFPQIPGKIKEPQGFGPEVIGSEIIYPGVDEDQ